LLEINFHIPNKNTNNPIYFQRMFQLLKDLKKLSA